MTDTTATTHERIIQAATHLLTTGGREAVSTRAVSAVAGVQPPTIYRQFGDMRGLLDSVASRGFAGYIDTKLNRVRADDPVDDLRAAWDLHVAFGLANPALYGLMYGDPGTGPPPSAARDAADILDGLVRGVAEAGRLRISVEQAAAMIGASSVGVTLTLLTIRPDDRDLGVSAMTREAVLAAITVEPTDAERADETIHGRTASHAIALKAVLPDVTVDLTAAERAVLGEWLDKLIDSSS